MINTLFKRILKTLFVTGLLALLIGCDGGIFGTGDGSSGSLITDGLATGDSVITDGDGLDSEGDGTGNTDGADTAIPSEPETPAVDSDQVDNVNGVDTVDEVNGGDGLAQSPEVSDPDSAGDIDTSIGTTDEFVATVDAVASVNGQLAFNNSVIVDDIATGFTLVNQTTMNVAVFDGPSEDAQLLLMLNADASGFGIFNPNISTLSIDQLTPDGGQINQITIDPLSVTPGSDSLFVLVESDMGIRLLAMPTYNDVASDNTFPRRMVATELVGDPEIPSVFVLTPDPSVEGSDALPVITFNPITAELPVTDFQNIPAGDYLLSDDSGRFSESITRIRVEADDLIRTIVLNPNFPGRVLGFGP